MKTIFGLGNPGWQYAQTRHNVGWMALDQLAADCGIVIDKRLRRLFTVLAHYGQGGLGQEKIRLIKPQTMMNRSGQVVAALLRRERDRMNPESILIVCDDVNLPLGRLRLRAEGGSGGHNGLADCLKQFGHESLPRLRVGVGGGARPGDGERRAGESGQSLASFVLAPFADSEKSLLNKSLTRAAEACALWVTRGVEAAMNRANATQEN